jgi:hypothetical protein
VTKALIGWELGHAFKAIRQLGLIWPQLEPTILPETVKTLCVFDTLLNRANHPLTRQVL